ncbi:WbuC family cupin fold metalloprotein [Niveibacterium sp. 24ML]|uniref:WbuC family cupin fold metalloprotein n=1 Tax=Niveibacterium sp. 24ML TaxID=2985512 RepID=UPI00226F7897|nr:WbuC family cupin fold metalloprotein [Niveibacterium sp. 24ML]MCX9156805.1 WbuC family cupin fold metalloprotein [Niveibacterium sp. 24ML]
MSRSLLLDTALLAPAIDAARASPRRRKNLNLHASTDELTQRFFNAMEPDSYVPPHRHLQPGKEETLIVVRGSLGVFEFDDAGMVTRAARVSAGADAFGIHVPLGTWHAIVALEPASVFIEIKGGPYVPFAPEDFAPWAPRDGTPEVQAWMDALRARVS